MDIFQAWDGLKLVLNGHVWCEDGGVWGKEYNWEYTEGQEQEPPGQALSITIVGKLLSSELNIKDIQEVNNMKSFQLPWILLGV